MQGTRQPAVIDHDASVHDDLEPARPCDTCGLDAGDAQFRIDHQHLRPPCHQRNRREVPEGVVLDVGVQEWHRRKAVEMLGISERTLRYKLKVWREAGFDVP